MCEASLPSCCGLGALSDALHVLYPLREPRRVLSGSLRLAPITSLQRYETMLAGLETTSSWPRRYTVCAHALRQYLLYSLSTFLGALNTAAFNVAVAFTPTGVRTCSFVTSWWRRLECCGLQLQTQKTTRPMTTQPI